MGALMAGFFVWLAVSLVTHSAGAAVVLGFIATMLVAFGNAADEIEKRRRR